MRSACSTSKQNQSPKAVPVRLVPESGFVSRSSLVEEKGRAAAGTGTDTGTRSELKNAAPAAANAEQPARLRAPESL